MSARFDGSEFKNGRPERVNCLLSSPNAARLVDSRETRSRRVRLCEILAVAFI